MPCAASAGRNIGSASARYDIHDVTETAVEVLAIVAKLEANSWLAQFGNPA